MAANSSSSTDKIMYCSDSVDASHIFLAYTITRIILVSPFCILIFYLGYQKWRKQHSFATTSHSDIFTYQMIALELILALGSIIYHCGLYTGNSKVMKAGYYISNVSIPGQMAFHILFCVERYLAVVHPVLYLKLKHSGGVKIRNISIVCAWIVSFVLNVPMSLLSIVIPFKGYHVLVILTLAVISFFSLRVLCVLFSPGPGESGGDRETVDQTKLRAFHTITAITALLWLWFGVFFIGLALKNLSLLTYQDECLVLVSMHWFSLPSNLIQPLLFLHRKGKLVCFK